MIKELSFVFLMGSECVSPIENKQNGTVAGKVPCAVMVTRDDKNQYGVWPPEEAKNPVVVAAITRRAQKLQDDAAAPVPAAPEAQKPPREPIKKKAKKKRRTTDACGSMRAVWYTNKQGKRKYRCVKR